MRPVWLLAKYNDRVAKLATLTDSGLQQTFSAAIVKVVMCHSLVAAVKSHACHSEETDPRGDAEDGQHLPLVGVAALCRGRRENSWELPENRRSGPRGGNYIVYWHGRLTHTHMYAAHTHMHNEVAATICISIKQPLVLSVSVSAGAGDRLRQSSVTCAKWSVIIISLRRSRQEKPKDFQHSRVQHQICVCVWVRVWEGGGSVFSDWWRLGISSKWMLPELPVRLPHISWKRAWDKWRLIPADVCLSDWPAEQLGRWGRWHHVCGLINILTHELMVATSPGWESTAICVTGILILEISPFKCLKNLNIWKEVDCVISQLCLWAESQQKLMPWAKILEKKFKTNWYKKARGNK